MPTHSSADEPLEDVTGTVSLPLARVKKIVATDDDIGPVSAQATFVIAKAAELFIQYAAQRAWDMAKAESKPKKSLTYTHIDNLEFLSDIAPQTTTLRAHKARKAQEAAAAAESSTSKSQGTLDPKQTTLGAPQSAATSDPMDLSGHNSSILRNDEDEINSMQPVSTGQMINGRHEANLVFQHYEPNGTSRPSGPQDDTEMS